MDQSALEERDVVLVYASDTFSEPLSFAGNIEAEVPVVVAFDTFSKSYFLDMLIQDCTIFELKAVERLSPEHRGQL